LIEQLYSDNETLKEENQQLKDEINYLKGEQGNLILKKYATNRLFIRAGTQ